MFRRYGDRLALLLVLSSGVNLALHAVENGTLLSMLTALLHVTGVPLRAVFGLELMTWMAIPLAPIYLAVAAWLMYKGFEERRRSTA